MCLCSLICTAGQREHPHANFSTAVQRHWSPTWSLSSRQESNPSLSSLLDYGSIRASSSQDSIPSTSRHNATSLSHKLPSGKAKGTYQSLSEHDTGYDASLDTGSVASSASSVYAVHGSVSGASRNKVCKQSLRLSTSNKAAEHYRRRKQARVRSSRTATNTENHVNEGKGQGASKPSTHPTAVSPAGASSTLTATTPVLSPARTQQSVIHDKPVGKHHSCCVGVLSQFEERFLSEADKHAILEGGCHGLCGLQITASVDNRVIDKGHETASQKSSPCVKGPFDKRARFVSPMPSDIMPNGRRGPDSSQPRFSRRRCAAQYQQPRQPLALAEHPSCRAAHDTIPTGTHPGQARQPLALAAHPSHGAAPHSTAPIAQPRPEKHASPVPSVIITKETKAAQPVGDLKLPHSKPISNCSPPRVRFAQDLVQQIPQPVTMQQAQIDNQKRENESTSVLKPKKRGSVRKLIKGFSPLLGRREST
jgi:hypothetical protein